MSSLVNKTGFVLFAAMAIAIGLYPLMYLLQDEIFGLLTSKSTELLKDDTWNLAFYTHISLGGVALLSGWSQFSSRLRQKYMGMHRILGKIYVLSVIFSGIAALYIAVFATGGMITSSGFFLLGVFWLVTTIQAYRYVRKGDILKHNTYMIYSYALCFAAVTLRIWLPLLTMAFGDFLPAYKIVAWLCWVPNLIVAYFINQKRS